MGQKLWMNVFLWKLCFQLVDQCREEEADDLRSEVNLSVSLMKTLQTSENLLTSEASAWMSCVMKVGDICGDMMVLLVLNQEGNMASAPCRLVLPSWRSCRQQPGPDMSPAHDAEFSCSSWLL
ncbi:hypothetical protein XENOCAPTIV_008896 [Xenoophorus captivus]|uniref:Uncharacterized protein n=1 Tax=Xenoophorus captivus TaxID=1517983 RepID=A0ABV0RDR3_9TELE